MVQEERDTHGDTPITRSTLLINGMTDVSAGSPSTPGAQLFRAPASHSCPRLGGGALSFLGLEGILSLTGFPIHTHIPNHVTIRKFLAHSAVRPRVLYRWQLTGCYFFF